eukprot:GHVU01121447.1.p2 GENE.GHVU01121447.1~~GHVU01121447.1.p2  ORF type:complete len:252 (+),score=25.21 GHVU01121447.1:105-758(+)
MRNVKREAKERRLEDSGNIRDPSTLPEESKGVRTDTWATEQFSRITSGVMGDNTGLRTPEPRKRLVDGVTDVTTGPGTNPAPSLHDDPAPSKAESRRMDDPGTRVATPTSPKPLRKLASKPWSVFDDTKHWWEEFKARTVNAARRSGHDDREIALALHEALPGDAVIYLDEREIGNMQLGDMLWHLDMLFQSKTKNPEVAQLALERVIRGDVEPAYR